MARIVGKRVVHNHDFNRYSAIHSNTVTRWLGGWRSVLERAGLASMYVGEIEVVRPAPSKYPDEELLEEVRRVAQLVGKPILTTLDFERHCRINYTTIKRRFGTWDAVLERAGIAHMRFVAAEAEPRGGAGRTEAYLLEEVRRVAEIVGKPWLTGPELSRHSKINVHSITRRFGGWRAALARAGLARMLPQGPAHYSEEELLEEVRRVARLVGNGALTMTDFDNHSHIMAATVSKRFGSWRTALERAGLTHMLSKRAAAGRNRPVTGQK